MNILSLPNELLLNIAKCLEAEHLANFIGAAPELYPLLLPVLEGHMIRSRPMIIWAVICGLEALVKVLLDNGVDIGTVTEDGATALHYAAGEGSISMVKLLMDYGADIDGPTGSDSSGWEYLYGAPLHWAIVSKNLDVVRFLIDNGVDPNQSFEDGTGKTALCLAAVTSECDVVRILLDKGADQFLCDNQEKMPLHYAVESHLIEVVTMLLREDREAVNVQDGSQRSLLHYAVDIWAESAEVCIEMTELLLRWGADTELGDEDDQTPLHLATADSNRDTLVNLLLRWGANIFAPDLHGRTPIQFAEMNEYHIDIIVRSKHEY